MSYEMVAQGSGFPAVSGFRGFGSAEGDALGTGCLCATSAACTSASAQGPAMAALRAAMRAAGIPTSSGVWKQSEANDLNAWSRARGGGTSSKFLVDGAPCAALKAFLSAPPAPVVVGPPATPIVDCASLLANAPPVPPGTPVDTVIAVLQSLAPAGFNVRACIGGAAPTTPTPDVLPPTGGSVTTVTGGSSSKLPFLLIGLAAVLGLGGVAFVALSPKMRKNGGRRKKRRHAATTPAAAARQDVGKLRSAIRAHIGGRQDPRLYNFVLAGKSIRFGRERVERLGLTGEAKRQFQKDYQAAMRLRLAPRRA